VYECKNPSLSKQPLEFVAFTRRPIALAAENDEFTFQIILTGAAKKSVEGELATLKDLLVKGFFDSRMSEGINRSADCEGASEEKRYRDAESCWRTKAQSDDLEAQFQLGKLYYHGEGIDVDKKQAAAWFTTAAERGNISAQSFLALLYLTGDGVPQSTESAIKWYEAAARGGDLSAAQNLAFHFREGTLLPRDLERSLYWCIYFVDRQKKDDLPSEFQNGCENWLKKN
jgi:TPR repeat protein